MTKGMRNGLVALVAALALTVPAAAQTPVTVTFMSWHGEADASYYAGNQLAVKEYMASHPGVTIKYVAQPRDGYTELLNTQFISDNGPDIVDLQPEERKRFMDDGYLLGLDAWFNQPSKYAPGKNWIDTFIGGAPSFDYAKASNRYGSISLVPLYDAPNVVGNQTPVYYNKDLFKKAGITNPPKTWIEFLDASKKLLKAGVIPVASDFEVRAYNWGIGAISGQFGEAYLNKFFDAKYAAPELFEDKRALALAQGLVKADDPIQNAIVDLSKEFSLYFQTGWAGQNYKDSQKLFLLGKAAMMIDGPWGVDAVAATKGLNWGIFAFPIITKASNKYSEEAVQGGKTDLSNGLSVNKLVEKSPAKLAAVIDFLQFMTSKSFQDKYTVTANVLSPVVGTTVPAGQKQFVSDPSVARLTQPAGFVLFDGADNAFAKGSVAEFLLGKITKQKLLQGLYEDAMKTQKKAVADALDAELGYPKKLSQAQAELQKLKDAKASTAQLQAQESVVNLIQLKFDLYKQYGSKLK